MLEHLLGELTEMARELEARDLTAPKLSDGHWSQWEWAEALVEYNRVTCEIARDFFEVLKLCYIDKPK